MRVAVLGGGIVGVTTAYQLVRDGHEVVVIDRQPGVARECSHANGGFVAISQAVPWSAPGVPRKTIMTMAQPNAPILLHLGQLPKMWRWGLSFIACSGAAISWENTRHVLRLALYSLAMLREVGAQAAIDYSRRTGGALKVFSDQESLDEAAATSEAQRALGLDYRVLDRAGCLALIPGLRPSIEKLSGGIHYPDEEGGDCFAFCQALAQRCREQGATFLFDTSIGQLETDGNRLTGIGTTNGRVTADHYVLAAGADSPLLMRPLGVRIPVIPVKGYSFTLPRGPWADAPDMPVLDELRKFGLMPLGSDRLRLSGFAEIAGYDTTPRERRKRAFMDSALGLFPQLAKCFEQVDGKPFCCLRPVTPSGLPILGRSRYANLFYNLGHGHLGWTLAHGTARIVADLIAGREPAIEMTGYGPPTGQ